MPKGILCTDSRQVTLQANNGKSATQGVVDKLHQKLITEALHPIKEASFDSYTNADEENCLPRTRTEILSEAAQWGESTPSSKFIFWLNGMAGPEGLPYHEQLRLRSMPNASSVHASSSGRAPESRGMLGDFS